MSLMDDLFIFGATNSAARGTPAAVSATVYGLADRLETPEGSGQAELSYYPPVLTRFGNRFPMLLPAYFQGQLIWTDPEGKVSDLELTIAAPPRTSIFGAPGNYEITVVDPTKNDQLLTQFVPIDEGDDSTDTAPSGKVTGNASIDPAGPPPLEAGTLSVLLEAIVTP